ncbi:hypothetical protein HanXRQr2_Chr13g0575531 [Helianthus annuus]|uniref:Secreted protein n=1 Tax=Helianthus annuus TaxID=4232 RepID=A0A9K3EF95_HELAN|nr:hypothetical protein HanXRQr2_Chr13g0575531 [Helianthus annuus]
MYARFPCSSCLFMFQVVLSRCSMPPLQDLLVICDNPSFQGLSSTRCLFSQLCSHNSLRCNGCTFAILLFYYCLVL